MDTPLHAVLTVTGKIFYHPEDGSATLHKALVAAGECPYQHLYDGDDIVTILAELQTYTET